MLGHSLSNYNKNKIKKILKFSLRNSHVWFFFSTRNSEIKSEKYAKRIGRLLYKRGPDDQIVVNNDAGKFIFSRLSIIDVSKRSSQPMSINDKNLTIMNNGEIYNY